MPRSCLSQSMRVAKFTMKVGGIDRNYLVHVPRCRSTGKLPLLLMLHGRGASALSASRDFGWIEKANNKCFIAVFPQALPINPALPAGAQLPGDFMRGWQVSTNDTLWWTRQIAEYYPYIANPRYPRVSHPPDAPFLEAVVDDALRRYGADAQHIYVVGFSSGAEMAADFAQFSSRPITAVAIVGSIGLSRPHRLPHPLPAFLIMGEEDFFGRPSQAMWNSMPAIAREKWYGQDSLPTLDEDLAAWAHLDGCTSRKTTPTPWGSSVDWGQCRDNVSVRGLSVDGLGHEWPGNKISRWNQAHPTRPPLRLTDEIWNFFSRSN